MGTVTIGDDKVEKKLDTISNKLSSQATQLNKLFTDLFCHMGKQLKQLKILNLHQQIITGEEIKKDDIDG